MKRKVVFTNGSSKKAAKKTFLASSLIQEGIKNVFFVFFVFFVLIVLSMQIFFLHEVRYKKDLFTVFSPFQVVFKQIWFHSM